MRWQAFALILGYEVCATIAQLLFKRATLTTGAPAGDHAWHYLAFLSRVMRQPWLWWGLAIFGAGQIAWIVALTKTDLNVAILLDSVHYVMVLLASYVILRERMTWERVLGTGIIVAGIGVVMAT